jgi:hypothetical protein
MTKFFNVIIPFDNVDFAKRKNNELIFKCKNRDQE